MLVGCNSDSYPVARKRADVWPFLPTILLCGLALLPSITLCETHQVFNRSGRMAGPLPGATGVAEALGASPRPPPRAEPLEPLTQVWDSKGYAFGGGPGGKARRAEPCQEKPTAAS